MNGVAEAADTASATVKSDASNPRKSDLMLVSYSSEGRV
jgi:hypothetical protein